MERERCNGVPDTVRDRVPVRLDKHPIKRCGTERMLGRWTHPLVSLLLFVLTAVASDMSSLLSV